MFSFFSVISHWCCVTLMNHNKCENACVCVGFRWILGSPSREVFRWTRFLRLRPLIRGSPTTNKVLRSFLRPYCILPFPYCTLLISCLCSIYAFIHFWLICLIIFFGTLSVLWSHLHVWVCLFMYCSLDVPLWSIFFSMWVVYSIIIFCL